MAHHVETTYRVHATKEHVWGILRDFSSIERFSSKVKSSPLVGESREGLGTKRLCTFYDKSTVLEEIIEYQEGENLRIELSEYSMPLKSLVAHMSVKRVDDQSCDATFGMEYVVKFGPLGCLMGKILMKPMMKGVTKDVLRGLAFHAVTGQNVGDTLPATP